MRASFRAPALVAGLAILSSCVQAINQITRNGRYLYTQDGSRFYIKGIAYQEQGVVVASPDNPFGEPSGFIDPLAQADACKRDLPFLQQLTVNTIRVYSVNSSLNHDACMQILSAAGIYTIIDLATPQNGSIVRDSPSWTTNLLDEYIATIDAFSKYDNVLAYNVGNEVVVDNSTQVAPFVKAAARDIKAYLKSKKLNPLVGYAAINGQSDFRMPLANYLSCDPANGNSDATAIDIYGLNDYEWCGDSNFQASYAGTTADYSGYNVVAYFSEYGCITSPPRLWTEAAALFSANMSNVWSGGVAFSYFPATSVQGQFGMVNISADGSTVTTSDDFNRLQAQYSQVSPPNSPAQSAAPASTYPSCPTTNSSWVASNTLPPTPNLAACNCLENALSCQFTPPTSNFSDIAGSLINVGCSLLGQQGGSCADIGGDGQTGVYGRVSACDPTVKTSYVMSQYYELNNRNPQACSFAGNGTINALAPSSSAAANSAASSCLSNAAAVFTPTAPAGSGSGGSGTGSSGAGGSSTSRANSGFALYGDAQSLVGLGIMSVIALTSGIWTLL